MSIWRKLGLLIILLILMAIVFMMPKLETDASDVSQMVNDEYWRYCQSIGNEYDIAPTLLMAICYTESGNNPYAQNDSGAKGLCQIIGKYQKDRMKRLGVTDLYDPYSNILVCADILHEFEGKDYEIGDALIAYNCGEYSKTFKKYYGTGNLTNYAKKVLKREEMLSEWMYGE